MRLAVAFLLFAEVLAAQSFPAVQRKRFWPDALGELRITDERIEFVQPGKPEKGWQVSYPDVQHLDRVSRTELVILTYEDQRWKFGRDRQFRFALTSGELSDELFETIRQRLNKPATDRVVPEVSQAAYLLPAKHLHTLGGCEGRLVFTPNTIYFQTDHAEDARSWKLASEVQSAWSAHPYHLEIHVYENNRREFSQTRIFNFALKEPLDPAFYRSLKLKLYELESAHLTIR